MTRTVWYVSAARYTWQAVHMNIYVGNGSKPFRAMHKHNLIIKYEKRGSALFFFTLHDVVHRYLLQFSRSFSAYKSASTNKQTSVSESERQVITIVQRNFTPLVSVRHKSYQVIYMIHSTRFFIIAINMSLDLSH